LPTGSKKKRCGHAEFLNDFSGLARAGGRCLEKPGESGSVLGEAFGMMIRWMGAKWMA